MTSSGPCPHLPRLRVKVVLLPPLHGLPPLPPHCSLSHLAHPFSLYQPVAPQGPRGIQARCHGSQGLAILCSPLSRLHAHRALSPHSQAPRCPVPATRTVPHPALLSHPCPHGSSRREHLSLPLCQVILTRSTAPSEHGPLSGAGQRALRVTSPRLLPSAPGSWCDAALCPGAWHWAGTERRPQNTDGRELRARSRREILELSSFADRKAGPKGAGASGKGQEAHP